MSLEAIVTALTTAVSQLPFLGHCHAYERILIPSDDVKDVFGIPDTTHPRGWSIRSWQWYRQQLTVERLDMTGDARQLTHHLVLRGYWEQNDAWQSEIFLRQTLDALEALLAMPLLIYPDATLLHPVEVMDGDRIMLAETYLCHHPRITVQAQEIVIGTPQDDPLILVTADRFPEEPYSYAG